jgi:hypothetical protein
VTLLMSRRKRSGWTAGASVISAVQWLELRTVVVAVIVAVGALTINALPMLESKARNNASARIVK